jgi:hypothetical protein
MPGAAGAGFTQAAAVGGVPQPGDLLGVHTAYTRENPGHFQPGKDGPRGGSLQGPGTDRPRPSRELSVGEADSPTPAAQGNSKPAQRTCRVRNRIFWPTHVTYLSAHEEPLRTGPTYLTTARDTDPQYSWLQPDNASRQLALPGSRTASCHLHAAPRIGMAFKSKPSRPQRGEQSAWDTLSQPLTRYFLFNSD